jgi:hypothetical protein
MQVNTVAATKSIGKIGRRATTNPNGITYNQMVAQNKTTAVKTYAGILERHIPTQYCSAFRGNAEAPIAIQIIPTIVDNVLSASISGFNVIMLLLQQN